MSIITIILFFLYMHGLGFTATKLTKIKEQDSFWEKNLMNLGIGMGIFPVLVLALNLLHIPLDWKILLGISMVFPCIYFLKSAKEGNLKASKDAFKLTKSNVFVFIVILIFFFALFMYSSGAFKYPYLEDDDPWSYAEAAKYVSVEKNLNDPDEMLAFLDPYPPAFASLMGVLHQTSPSILWTLKFFNALIISLGIIFFFFFAKQFTKDRNIALFSTFVLAMLPCYFTHFIWAISMALPLFFVAIYCFEKIEEDSKWLLLAALVSAGLMLTHPSKLIKLSVLFVFYFGTKCIMKKRFLKKEFFAAVLGIIIGAFWWVSNWQGFFLTRANVVDSGGSSGVLSLFSLSKIKEYFAQVFAAKSGTATQAYTFNDFFIAKTQGMINVQVGFGIMASILLLFGFIYIFKNFKAIIKDKDKGYWIITALIWFILMFLNVNSATFNLPIGFISFRSWLILAVPTALICALGLNFLIESTPKLNISKELIIAIAIMGILLTSGYQKYALNTASWPPGAGWTSQQEVNSFVWLNNLPADTKVFTYGTDDTYVIGLDKYSCFWCKDTIEFRKIILQTNAQLLHDWLQSRGYDYIVISGLSFKHFSKQIGENETQQILPAKIEEIAKSKLFAAAYQTESTFILKIL